MSRISATWIVIAPAWYLASALALAPEEKVQLTIATLHAAALTKSRAAGDTTDAPFFVVTVAGPRANTASILPDAVRPRVPLNGALGARPLTELSLAEGDSVQVQISVLENAKADKLDDSRIAATSSKARATSVTELAKQATALIAPLLKEGAHWIGSVNLLVTNEGGAIFWRRLECVASCTVLTAPAANAMPASNAQPFAGVVELTGNGGTYHLALRANRAP